DVLLVTDIYAASETPIDGVNAEVLTNRIKSYGHKNAEDIGALENGAQILGATVREGDLVITLGGGSVHRGGEQLWGRSVSERGRSDRLGAVTAGRDGRGGIGP